MNVTKIVIRRSDAGSTQVANLLNQPPAFGCFDTLPLPIYLFLQLPSYDEVFPDGLAW